MAKLSQQLKEEQQKRQQGRQTRGQRVAKKQALERAERERQRLERLRKQAEQIKAEKFKDKVVEYQEEYKEYRPSKYTAKQWNRMSQKQRNNAMRGYSPNRNIYSYDQQVKRGNLVVHAVKTRTATKTIPFTLEDKGDNDYSYKDVYETLSPDLKQFFQTPEKVVEDKYKRIDETKKSIAEKREYAKQKIARAKEKLEKREKYLDKKWDRYKDRYSGEKLDKKREQIKEDERDADDDYDETVAYWKGYQEGLGKAEAQLNQGKDLSIKDVLSYADDIGDYKEDREYARNRNKKNFRDAKRKGELDEAFKKLGVDKDISYYKYKQKVKDFNKDVAYRNQLIKWGEKVGFDKLPSYAQEKINPDLAKWQKENPNEKLIFKGVTPVAVESGALQQSLTLENYQKVTSPEYIKEQWRKNNPPPPAPVRFDVKSGGFQSYDPQQAVQQMFKPNPDYIDIGGKFVSGDKLPVGYGTQGTIQLDGQGNEVAPSVFLTTDQLNKIKLEELKTPKDRAKELWGAVKTGYSWANERVNSEFDADYWKKPVGIFSPINVRFGKIEKVDDPIYDGTTKTTYDFDFNAYAKAQKEGFTPTGQQVLTGDLPYLQGTTQLVDVRTEEQKTGKTNVGRGFDKFFGWTGDKKGDIVEWVVGKDNIEKAEQDLESKYQGIYQYNFEQKYFEDIVDEKITFEDAQKEFAESGTAKSINKQYVEEYGETMKELKTDVPFWTGKGGVGGLGVAGLSLAEFGGKAISTPLNTAVTVGAVYTGAKVLQAVPYASTTLSGGLIVYGGSKALNPNLTFEERGSGLLTATISGISLGTSGYRYLKQGVKVETVKIKPPKMNLKSTASVGKDVKWKVAGKSGNTVIYGAKKISQKATAGYRTVWTSRGRLLFNKYIAPLNKRVVISKVGGSGLGTRIRIATAPSKTYWGDLYKGVPYAQKGQVTVVQGLRGTYTIKEPSAYQKMFARLQKYNKFTPSQARASLRYVAPRVYETYPKGLINVNLKTGSAKGTLTQTIKRPVIEVDKNLGIKTRGGADLKDVTKVWRKLQKDPTTNKIFAQEYGVRFQGFTDKAGKMKDWKEFELFGRKTRAVSLNQKGYEYLGKVDGIDVYRPDASFKNIFSVSKKDALTFKITKSRFGYKGFVDYNPARQLELRNTIRFNKVIDLDKSNTFFVKPANVKKTPFSSTFGGDQSTSANIKRVADKIDDVGSGSSNVDKIVREIKTKTDFGGQASQSQYYGTGMYERTDAVGGLTQNQILQNQNLLKIDTATPIKFASPSAPNVLIKQLGMQSLTGNVLEVLSLNNLKSDNVVKNDLKVNMDLKNLIKTDILVKTQQDTSLKTSPALKQQLKTNLLVDTPPITITNPNYRPPTPPTPKPPIPKPVVIPFLKAKTGKGTDAQLKKQLKELAYLPDFTSRALGLGAETLSQKQAQKRLNKLLTGLEIRRGVVVR